MEGALCLAGSPAVAKTKGYFLVCIWGSLIKFQGSGVVSKVMLFARLDSNSFCTGSYRPVFQSLVYPSNRLVFCLTGCHVVAKTQGYLLVCIWRS